MTQNEKAELLKGTIFQLYSKEGRSKSYIERLLKISRSVITKKIKEWGFPEPEPARHLTPSTRKFLNKHREQIISFFRNNLSEAEIARRLKIDRSRLRYLVQRDEALTAAKNEMMNRKQTWAEHERELQKERSARDYLTEETEGEEWRPILGYETYEISNLGRVRRYAERTRAYYLLHLHPNQKTGRMYVSLYKDGKMHNLLVARLVAFTFLQGHSESKNTVNHKNGNIRDDRASNLEWVSQSENLKHAYDSLKRPSTYGNQHKNRYSGKYFRYQDRYEFKTVKALARFIGRSETQIRRYLETDPKRYGIEIIEKAK